MPFVRRRKSRAGTAVTTLVESYRDDEGRPRQRVIANLHGAASADQAIARLAAVRSRLKKDLAPIAKEAVEVRQFQVTMAASGFDHLSREQLAEMTELNRRGNHILERERRLKSALKATQKDGGKLQRYRTWNDTKMQSAIKNEAAAIDRAMAEAIGERAVVAMTERRRSAGSAKLRQYGATALFDEREWIGIAKAVGSMQQPG